MLKNSTTRNFTLLLAVLILSLKAHYVIAQSCPQNDIGFNTNVNVNTLSICVGTSGTTIDGGDPGGQEFEWYVTDNLATPFTSLSPDPGDVQNIVIPAFYYNTPGTYYFRREVSSSASCDGYSDTLVLTVNGNATLSLSSPAGTDNQNICINTTIVNITYNIGGSGTGATVSGLPAGVSSSYAAGLLTITGGATAGGVFNYTVTTTGPCTNPSLGGVITVAEENTVALSSLAGTDAQAVCIGLAIADITYATSGATAIGAPAGLPAGVTASWAANVITISGTPTAPGTFNYTIPLTGGCGTVNATGSITVTAANTAGAASSAPTLCINTALINITHSTTGATGIGVPAGLPAGVTAAWAADVITISGTPTAPGTFNYTIPLTGGCGTVSATGTITVTANNTPGTASSNPTLCVNTPLTNITRTTTGATGIAVPVNLPAGVTAVWSANVITISGTPTSTGTFNYSIPLTGGCGLINATGTITVTADNSITRSSAPGTDAQTGCINTAITNITYSTTGATGASFTGLPAGVTGNWAGNIVTISGTPTVSGSFNYMVTLTGGCGNITASGSINVTANNTVSLSSAVGTNAQTICLGNPVTNISYNTTGATGAGFSGLPAGVTGNWAANTITITGTPTVSGTFNYTVTLTGGCGTITANGSIVVNTAPVASGTAICVGASGSLTSSAACAAATPGTAGPNFAQSGVTGGGAGTGWTAPGNIISNNNVNATVAGTGNAFSEALVASNFGFAVPAGAVINGIQVSIGRFRSGGGPGDIQDNSVRLFKTVGAAIGNNNGATSTNWPVAEGVANYGTTTDLWGVTWTPAEINAAGFGVALVVDNTSGFSSKTANVDYVQITVSYSIPGTLGWFTAASGGSSIGSNSPFNPVGVAGSGLANTNTAGTTTYYAECAAAPGCRTAAAFVINALPTIGGNLNVCIGSTSALTGSGTPAASTPWTSATTSVATVNAAGVVTGVAAGSSVITYTNSNGCSVTTTVTVSAPAISGTLNVCVGATRSLAGNGTPAASNPWISSNSSVATVNSSGLVTGVAPGTATITYTNNFGCFVNALFTVNSLPVVSFTGSNVICTGSTTTLSPATGGTWTSSNAAVATVTNGGVVTGVAAGTATFTFTSSTTTCSSTTGAVTVNARPSVSFTASPGASTCTNTSVTYTTQAGQSSYVWSVPGVVGTNYNIISGNTGSTSNTVTIQWLTTGSKTVTVNYNNSNGCSGSVPASNTTTVNARPIPTFTASPAASLCSHTSVTYTTQSGQTSYAWNVPGVAGTDFNITAGGIGAGSNTVTLQWLTGGSKTVTVNYNNGSGCNGLSPASSTITVNARPVANAITGATSVCIGSTINLNSNATGNPVLSYTWSSANAGLASVTNAGVVTGVAAGTVNISYTVSDGNSCVATSPAFAVTVNTRPTISFTASPGANSCAGTNITYTTQAGQSNYVWVLPGSAGIDYNITSGGIGSTSNTVTLQWLTTGSKTVTVNYANVNGCTGVSPASSTTTVNPRPTPTFTAAPGASSCVTAGSNTTDITYTTQAGQSNYLWVVPGTAGTDYTIVAGGIGTGSNTVTLRWLTTGSKTVTVNYTNASTCTALTPASSSTTVIALPVVSTSASVLCANETINAFPGSGGTWISSNNAVATIDNSGLITGVSGGTVTFTYTLTATGCSKTTAPVTVNALPVLSPVTDGAPAICVNDITQFSNATPGGTWSVINGTGNATIDAGGLVTGVSAGLVTIVYSYDNGTCSNSVSAPLTVNALPFVAPIGGGAVTVCVNAQTPAFTNATAGGTWSVIDGTGSASISPTGVVTGVSAGTVTVIYTVGNGTCSNDDAVVLTINPLPFVAPITGGTTAVCVNASTPAFTNATSGGTWSVINGTGTATITAAGVATGLSAGAVTIVYSYTNGICTNTATQSLTVNPLPVIAPITGGAASVCINASTVAFTNATAGGSWSVINGTGSATITAGGIVTGLTAGNVTVVYTVGSGLCFNDVTTALVVNALPVAGAITGPATVCAGSTITLNSNASGTGSLSYNWVSASPANATVSISGIVTGASAGSSGITYTVTDGNNCSAISPLFTVTVNARPTANITSASTTICNAGSTNISGTVTATGAWTVTLSDGSTASGSGNGVFNISVSPTASTTYSLTSLTDAVCVAGLPDLTGSATVTVNQAVVINTNPTVSQTVCSGNTVTLTVAASGTGLTYQWRKGTTPLSNGGNISGATSATLTITGVTTADAAADYNVVVSGAAPCAAAVSGNAILIVNEAVVITDQPDPLTLCSGSDAVFSVAATGDGLTFQWRKNGSPLLNGGNIFGANTNTLNITGVSASDAANYSVVVSGVSPCSPVTSANALLTVNLAPSITVQPLDAAVCATFPATFAVTAVGSGLTYQWYKGTFPGTPVTNSANISGAATATLHFNQANLADVDDYYVIVSGLAPCVAERSDYAHLSVDRNITILRQPVSQTVCIGSDVSFDVHAAAGGDPLIYQWRKNGIDIAGAQDTFYTITGTVLTDAANYDVVITGLAGCITSFSSIAVLSLDALSVGGTVTANTSVCNGTNSGTLNLTGHTGLVVRWEFSTDNGGTWTPVANTTTSLIYNNIAIETQYRAVVQNGVCNPVNSAPATISIKPTPDVTPLPASQTVCSGTAISTIVLSGTVPSTNFDWTRDNQATVSGILSPGSGNISGTLVNTTASPVTVTFTITPTAGGCPGIPATATVIVNPAPVTIATPSSQTICSGDAISTIVFSSATAGSAYNWSRDNLAITGINGTGSGDISGTLVNSTNAPVTVNFSVTAVSNTCPGPVTVATVTVNPSPTATAVPSTQTVCSGASITTVVLNSNVSGTNYNWTRDNLPVTGILPSGTGNISGSLTNSGTAPETVIFTIIPIANGCPGLPETATVIVEPVPDATATPASQTICSGSAIAPIILSSALGSTTYNWTRDNAALTGIPLSGNGDISGTLTNSGILPVTVTFTITPFAAGCPGASITATVVVNPTPNAAALPVSQTACSGAPITTISLSGTVASTSFDWTRDNNAAVTGIPATGNGDISGTLVNTTASPVTVTFTITPTANGCPGAPVTATVVVNPSANAIATPSSQSICSGNSMTTIVLTSSFGSTTYNWTRDNITDVTGIGPSGSGDISGTLINLTTSAVTVTFTIVPTSGGCPGTSTLATVVVNPGPDVVAAPLNQSVCSGDAIAAITMSSGTPGANLNWVRDNTVSVTGIAASGTGSISGTLTNTTNTAVTVAFTVTPSLAGCIGAQVTANVLVKPLPTITATNTTQTICSGPVTAIAVANPNNVSGTVLSWTRDNAANLTGIAASGNGSISGSLNNTTALQQITNFVITAAADGCSASVPAVITVNPRPVMTSAAAVIVCNNSAVNLNLTSTVSSNYSWIAANNANVTGESITAQTTSTINNTLVNTSPVSQLTPKQNVTYTVTPTAIPAAGGCAGTPQTVIATVMPSYNISFYEYPTDDNSFTICDGDLIGGGGQNDMDLIQGAYAGSTLLWQYSTAGTGGPWFTTPGPHVNGAIHDTLPDPPSVFSPMGNYWFRLTVDGCPSDIISMTKTSTLELNAGGPSNTVCQTGTPAAITLSGASVTGTAATTVGGYWSVTSLVPSNGGNNGTLSSTAFLTPAQIPAATYTPPANYAGVVTLTLTSNDPDNNGPCVPLTKTRTIIVNQAPIISNASTMSICSGSNTNITLSSVIPSTYTWTLGTITGGITGATAGSGNLINQVLTNPGTSPGTVQYVVTPIPIAPASCAAVTATITVTVSPLPSVGLTRSVATICPGSVSTLTATSSGGTLSKTYSGYSGSLNMYITDDSRAAYAYPGIALSGSGAATLTATDIVEVKFNINHPYVQDLDIFLVDPSGTRAMLLSADNGGTGDNYTNTIVRTDVVSPIITAGTAPFNSTYRQQGAIATAPVRTGAAGGGNYNLVIPANALTGAPVDGTWTLRVFDDATNDYGSLIDWSLAITKTSASYTVVFNGPATIGPVNYPTVNTATADVTPPVGSNTYTVTTTDLGGCSVTSAPVTVTVNPEPTLTSVTQAAVCSGSTAQIVLSGLLPNSTSTVTYKVGTGSTQVASGIIADASGVGSFNVTLSSANNGQSLQITSLTITNPTPNCAKLISQSVTLVVNPLPTLTGAVQAGAVCPGSGAQINLTGLVPNSTSTINYSIAGVPQPDAVNVAANASGAASFTSSSLSFANNGQTLTVTGVTITSATPNCPQAFTRNLTLSVNATPVLSSSLTPPSICSATSFFYTPASASGGATFTWSRAAVAGISQAASSGSGNISEPLTNTAGIPVSVTYIIVTTSGTCNNAPGEAVQVTVNPMPTITAVAQPDTACSGSASLINVTGLSPNGTFTLNYSINGVAQPPATGVVSNAAGNASFNSTPLTAANNGQLLRITGIVNTGNSPSCIRSGITGILVVLKVKQQPSLSAVAQAAAVCNNQAAVINLSGLVANSTNNTISYTINGVAQPVINSVAANAAGNASFVTTLLTSANNGQTLTVTGIANGTCSSVFAQSLVLSVGTINTWLGVNTNWFDAQNWCSGVPTSSTDVIIPGSLANYPLLNTGTGAVRNISIQNTASVTVSNAKLQIAGVITNTGIFNALAGTIELNGATPQTISGGLFANRIIDGLIISNASGVNVSNTAGDTLNITDSLSFGNVNNAVLSTGNNITLVSRAGKTARVADITNASVNSGNSFTGKFMVERYIPEHRAWRLLTAPLQTAGSPTFNVAWQEGVVNPDYVYANRLDPHPGYGMHITGVSPALGFDPSTNNNPSIKHYDPLTAAWIGIPNTLSAKVADSSGYMVFVRGDRNIPIYLNTAAPTSNTVLRAAGQLKTNNQVSTVPAGVGPYTVVGNPYPSAIDLRKVSVSGAVSNSNFVTWDPALTGSLGVGAYQYFTQSGGPGSDYIIFPGPGGGSYGPTMSVYNTIESGQAFMIQNAGTGTVSINENAKVSTSTSNVFRPSSPASQPVFGYISTLFQAENEGSAAQLADGTLSMFNQQYSDEVDLDDARKLLNFSSENFGIDSKGEWLAIEKRNKVSELDTIQYKMRFVKVKNYQLAVTVGSLDGVTAILEDQYLKAFTPLNAAGTTIYHFSINTDSGAWNPTRFRIVFKQNVVLPVSFTNVKAYRDNEVINVDWSVAQEQGILNYDIEKSIDGIHFTKLFTEQHVVNSDRSAAYQWIDQSPVSGYNYYRIRSNDRSGVTKFSPVVKVLYEKPKAYITVYPNPVTDGNINLYFVNQPQGEYLLRLLSNTGQLIAVKKLYHTTSTTAQPFKTQQALLHGTYLVEINKPDGSKQIITVMY